MKGAGRECEGGREGSVKGAGRECEGGREGV